VKNHLRKIFGENIAEKIDWTIVGSVLLGAGFLGMFLYVNYQSKAMEQVKNELVATNEKVVLLESTIKDISAVVLATLTEEERKNEDLEDALEEISDNVETLGRVATTDRDLLKKYSKTYFLNENYIPLDLSPIPSKWRSPTAGNYQILEDVEPYLTNLFKAADEDGLDLLAQSAYRSFATQSELKAAYTVTYGSGANRFSADQGYSEHQLGTTLDFTTKSLGGSLEGFGATPEYAWLLDNAYRYGFILSYPEGNEYYKYEPWHWRFVGKALARELHNEDMNFYDMDQRVIDSYLTRIFD
jgi:zinc D-Ala-D-Ala carboxypeptidase